MDLHASEITPTCMENAMDLELKDGTSSPRDSQVPMASSPTSERRLRTKIDLAICPIVCILYLFCFIDRANIGMMRSPGVSH